MANEDQVLVTKDAAMHRAFHKVAPFFLDPVDEKILSTCTDVMTTEQMLAYVKQEMLEQPEKHRPPPGQTPTEAMEQIRQAAQKAPERLDTFMRGLKPQLTRGLAEVIRSLRTKDGYSWRAIARVVSLLDVIDYPPVEPNDQLVGMALCALAAEKFGEDYLAAPWNVYPDLASKADE